MTVTELCDVAYALLVEKLERFVLAERQAAASLAPWAKDVTFPDMDKACAEFDAALVAEPEQVRVDPERRDLMVALGLGVR